MRKILTGLMASVVLLAVASGQTVPQVEQRPNPRWASLRMNVHVEDGLVSDILGAVEKAGDVSLRYDDGLKELVEHRVTMHVKDGTLCDVLKLALSPSGLTYKVIDEKTIQITWP